jgi:hypothetical protein
MASEGPYRIEEVKQGYSVVFGPGLYPEGNRACFGEDLQSTLNYAHAEGRKAERERCLGIVRDYCPCHDEIVQIEKRIRGGQDGK